MKNIPKAMFGNQNQSNSVSADNTPLEELATQFKHKKTAIRRYSKAVFN